MIRILADFHHHALWESLRLVFEERFGWELYRPIGMDWFSEGYWLFERDWHGDAVARQYLSPYGGDADRGDYSTRPDSKYPGQSFKMVTLDQFRDQRWDLVLTTLGANAAGFARLAREKGAPIGVQIGNQWNDLDMRGIDFVLASATIPTPAIPHVYYHQEFDLGMFRYEPPIGFGPVASFLNCFAETTEYPRFRDFAAASPDLDWRCYGAYGTAVPDEYAAGDIAAVPEIADLMRACSVGYHAKYWSDGFGHVIHNWAALGRPVVGARRYYADKLAGPLWVEGVTSWDIDHHSQAETIDFLRGLRSDPERHGRMCEAMAARFREVVDFDAQAESIRALCEWAMSRKPVAA